MGVLWDVGRYIRPVRLPCFKCALPLWGLAICVWGGPWVVIYGRLGCFWLKCGLTTLEVGEVCTWGRGSLYTDGPVAFGLSVALPLWGSVMCVLGAVGRYIRTVRLLLV